MIFVHFKKDKELKKEVLDDMLATLFMMTKLSPERQEMMVKCGGIPLILSIAKGSDKDLKKTAIEILCSFLKHSDRKNPETLTHLANSGTLEMFSEAIEANFCMPKILEAMTEWFQSNPPLIVDTMCSQPF